jgi:hypothetical protein
MSWVDDESQIQRSKRKSLKGRGGAACNERGYKGSRLIIANMFLLLTLCSILPSVRAVTVTCEYYTAQMCTSCSNKPDFCTACRPGYGFKLDGTPGKCYPFFEIHADPKGYGWDSSRNAFAPCSTAGVKSCWPDYTSPTSIPPPCSGEDLIKIDGPTRLFSCLSPYALVDTIGYGKATPVTSDTPRYMIRCFWIMARSCDEDFMNADTCLDDSVRIPAYPNSCVERTAMGFHLSGYGWKLEVAFETLYTVLAKCYSPYCRDCYADYGMCAECEYFAINYYGTCVFYAAMPSTFLGNTVSKTSPALTPCPVENCLVCATDDGVTKTCYLCKNKQNFGLPEDLYSHPVTGTCVKKTDLPAGYGVDPHTYLVRPCEKTDCIECLDNFRLCTRCGSTDGFGRPLAVVDAGFCTSVPAANLVGWGPDPSITTHAVYKRCSNSACAYCQTNYGSCDNPTLASASTCSTYVKNCISCIAAREATTCKGCGNNEYVNTFFGTECYKNPNTMSRYGLVGAGLPNQFSACVEPNCYRCLEDYLVCQECDYPYTISNGKCVLTANKIGFDWTYSPPGAYAPCSLTGCSSCYINYQICDDLCTDQNCQDCSADLTKCAICKTDSAAQTYLVTDKCYLQANLPAGYGIDKTKVKEASACSDTNCKECLADNAVCTLCDTANKWYLGTKTGTTITQCQKAGDATAGFPAKFGPNLTTKKVERCLTPGCIKCDDDINVCTACDQTNASNKWYLGTDPTSGDKKCYNGNGAPFFPDGYGPKAGDVVIAPCTFAHCKKCYASLSTCTECKNNDGGWYMGVTAGTSTPECQSADKAPMFPAKYGPDLSNLKVVSCTPNNCNACAANKNICTLCDNTGTTKWYLGANAATNAAECQSSSTSPKFPVGYGPNTSNNKVEACSITGCTACPDTIATCTACNTGSGYFLGVKPSTTENQCQKAGDPLVGFPESYGPDSGSSTVKKCTLANCKTCDSGVAVCDNCLYSSGWYLGSKSGSPECQKAQDSTSPFPNGYGPNLTNKLVEMCKITGCTNCEDNIEACKACNESSNYFLGTESGVGTCFHKTNKPFPEGYGPKIGSAIIDVCTPANCKTCADTIATCDACKNLQGWYLGTKAGTTAKECQSATTAPLFPTGYGPNLSTLLVEP